MTAGSQLTLLSASGLPDFPTFDVLGMGAGENAPANSSTASASAAATASATATLLPDGIHELALHGGAQGCGGVLPLAARAAAAAAARNANTHLANASAAFAAHRHPSPLTGASMHGFPP